MNIARNQFGSRLSSNSPKQSPLTLEVNMNDDIKDVVMGNHKNIPKCFRKKKEFNRVQ